MANESQPSLFDPEPQSKPAIIPPSVEFAAAHPELVDTTPLHRVPRDPNARRTEQLRGVGGGLAAANAGELSSEPAVEVDPITYAESEQFSREDVMALTDAIRARSKGVTAGELAITSMVTARDALQAKHNQGKI